MRMGRSFTARRLGRVARRARLASRASYAQARRERVVRRGRSVMMGAPRRRRITPSRRQFWRSALTCRSTANSDTMREAIRKDPLIRLRRIARRTSCTHCSHSRVRRRAVHAPSANRSMLRTAMMPAAVTMPTNGTEAACTPAATAAIAIKASKAAQRPEFPFMFRTSAAHPSRPVQRRGRNAVSQWCGMMRMGDLYHVLARDATALVRSASNRSDHHCIISRRSCRRVARL